MQNKRFILNADDFGMSKDFNQAVLNAYEIEILKSASLTANGNAFDDACENIIPKCPNLGIGIHLNIIEGNSILSNLDLLTDNKNVFNNSYGQLLVKSFSLNNKEFLAQVEREFRAQIEKVKSNVENITHIDSHVHTHSISPIFAIVCKLAKEYGIKQVRTQLEIPYFIPKLKKHINLVYPINLIKVMLLNTFTGINRNIIKKYDLMTNDFLIGVAYTSMMDSDSIFYGLKVNKFKNTVSEALIHPCKYENIIEDNHYVEYLITQNVELKDKIKKLGFEITNYVEKN